MITSVSVCIPIVHICREGLFIAAMDYTLRGNVTLRHIVETMKGGSTVMKTLADGLRKEGAKDRNNFAFELLSKRPIHIGLGKDQNYPGGIHAKPVFPVFVREDMLRDYEQPDDDDPEEIHGPIKMWGVRDLVRVTIRKTIPFHFHTTLAVVEWAARDHEIYTKYEDLVLLADQELFIYRPTSEIEAEVMRLIAA